MTPQRLALPSDVVEKALEASSADHCIVICEESSEADVRFANNTTTTNGERRDRRVSVISFQERADGVAVGIASASGPGAIADLVAAADAQAATASISHDAAPLIAGGADGDFAEAAPTTDLGVLAGVLDELPDAFARAVSAGHVLAGFAHHSVTTTYLASSTGLRRRHVQPDGALELVARADGGARSTWASAGTRDFSDVVLSNLEGRLLNGLSWAKRRIDLPAGRYEVLLPPDAVADLMIPLEEAASGRDAEDGQNVFAASSGATRIGDVLSDLPMNLFSDPSQSGLECEPYVLTSASGTDVSVFDNGAPVARTAWINEGRLEHLRYHRAGATRSDTGFCPPVDNLVLEVNGASGDLASLIASTERALLLTCLWYIREVDPTTLLLTGLTRDGVYLVEHGEVVGAVNNFRFNESPLDVLSHTIEAGRSERALSREWNEWMSRTAMPALRVAEFNMSSVSPAS